MLSLFYLITMISDFPYNTLFFFFFHSQASFAPAPFKTMIPDNVRMIRSTASQLRAMGDRGRTLAMIIQARIEVEDFKSTVSVNTVRKLGNTSIQEMRDYFYCELATFISNVTGCT